VKTYTKSLSATSLPVIAGLSFCIVCLSGCSDLICSFLFFQWTKPRYGLFSQDQLRHIDDYLELEADSNPPTLVCPVSQAEVTPVSPDPPGGIEASRKP
jgi:hypothetical protein